MKDKRRVGQDAEALKAQYDTKQQQLADALLRGAAWEEVKEKQYAVTRLSIQLYKCISRHPAAYGRRK
ncbi:hypothetical protein HRH25_15380 [Flavisolibacter sp. BT320]|nr:hypothetical protein [Flavisolibacter longurius]